MDSRANEQLNMGNEPRVRGRQGLISFPLALLAAMTITCSRGDLPGSRPADTETLPSIDLPLSASTEEPAIHVQEDAVDTEAAFSTVPPNTVDVHGLTAVSTITNQHPFSNVTAGLCCYRDPTGRTADQRLIGGDIGLLRTRQTATYSVELPCGIWYQCDAAIHYDRCPLPPDYNAHWHLGVRRGFTACPGTPFPRNPRGPSPTGCTLTQDDCPGGPFNPVTCSCEACPPLTVWNGAECEITG